MLPPYFWVHAEFTPSLAEIEEKGLLQWAITFADASLQQAGNRYLAALDKGFIVFHEKKASTRKARVNVPSQNPILYESLLLSAFVETFLKISVCSGR